MKGINNTEVQIRIECESEKFTKNLIFSTFIFQNSNSYILIPFLNYKNNDK